MNKEILKVKLHIPLASVGPYTANFSIEPLPSQHDHLKVLHDSLGKMYIHFKISSHILDTWIGLTHWINQTLMLSRKWFNANVCQTCCYVSPKFITCCLFSCRSIRKCQKYTFHPKIYHLPHFKYRLILMLL